jgi:hypothetical protein
LEYQNKKRAAERQPEFREETPHKQASDMAGKVPYRFPFYRKCEEPSRPKTYFRVHCGKFLFHFIKFPLHRTQIRPFSSDKQHFLRLLHATRAQSRSQKQDNDVG